MPLLKMESPLAADARGIYRIYARPDADEEVTLYIGRSRNISQRMRGYERSPKLCRTFDPCRLDTRIVIHASLEFLQARGIDCYMEHLDWNCDEEEKWARELVPLLQRLDGRVTCLRPEYYLKREDGDFWRADADAVRIKQRLFALFEQGLWPWVSALCPRWASRGGRSILVSGPLG